MNDVWRSNDLGANWSLSVQFAPWQARYGHAMVAVGNTILLLGGLGGTGGTSKFFQVFIFYMYSYARFRIYLITIFSSKAYYNDVWISTDRLGAVWTKLTTFGTIFTARYGHAVVLTSNNKIVVTGGISSAGVLADVYSSTATVTCTAPNFTGSSSACTCANGYSGTVVYTSGNAIVLSGCTACASNGWVPAGNGLACSSATACSVKFAGTSTSTAIGGVNTGCTVNHLFFYLYIYKCTLKFPSTYFCSVLPDFTDPLYKI